MFGATLYAARNSRRKPGGALRPVCIWWGARQRWPQWQKRPAFFRPGYAPRGSV